jgi:2-C-methyl-D-erythritol 4-phosphate cytidylyltransferase
VVVIWVADNNAFYSLGKSSVLNTAATRAATAQCKPKVIVAIANDLKPEYEAIDAKRKSEFEVHFVSTVNELKSLVSAQTQVMFVHDAARPLTSIKTFQSALDAVRTGAAAARPAHVVVDTLKQIDSNRLVTATIDRNSVQALTSPECYWVSSITNESPTDGWSFSIEPSESKSLVQGDLESIRVRCAEDVVLVESFLEWERINHSSS